MNKQKFKTSLNHIFFLKNIEKIKYDSFKNYFSEFFTLKVILIKLITFVLTLLICGLCFFLIRNNMLNNPHAHLQFNKGIAFSFGNNMNQDAVYAIKSLISIFFLLLWFFNNKWYLNIFAFIIASNGFFNIIDKAIIDNFNGIEYVDAVVDYIFLASGTNIASVANVADIFITIGICFFILGIIFYIYVIFKEEKEQKNQQQPPESK